MTNIDIKLLRELQASINADIDSLISSSESPKGEHHEKNDDVQGRLHSSASTLAQLVSNPAEQVLIMGFQPTTNMAVRIAIDLDLFNLIGEKQTLQSLVEKTGAEESLLERLLRLLVAVNIFGQPEVDTYTSTKLSQIMTFPPFRDWLKMTFDSCNSFWQDTPAFVRANSFRDITDLKHNPFTARHNASFFEYTSADPGRAAEFASAMAVSDNIPPDQTPVYPYDHAIAEMSSSHTDDDGVFIVDIGGGHGQYIHSVLKQHPALPGKAIVQDLPETIATIPTSPPPPFTPQTYDFFTPQPIQHAKFYHLRQVLHDWPDDACVQILSQIRPVMRPGFSRILINGSVLPTMGAGIMEALTDLAMMLNCGAERDERRWKALLERAGLRINKIYRAEKGSLAVMEVVRDDEE